MIKTAEIRFSLGRVVATPGALGALQNAGQSPREFLDRHASGDWGDLSEGDRQLNDEAVKDGSRIFSAYAIRGGQKIWIITEAADDQGQRAATTILLPEEY
jgi:hypothetical protein